MSAIDDFLSSDDVMTEEEAKKWRAQNPDAQTIEISGVSNSAPIQAEVKQEPSAIDDFLSSTSDKINPALGDRTLQIGPFDTGINIGEKAGQILEAAGKSVVDNGIGAKQLGAKFANLISPSIVSDQTIDNIQRDIDEAKKRDAPLMNTGGGLAGYIGGSLASTLLPFGIAANVSKAANAPKIAGALSSMINPSSYAAAGTAGALQGLIQPVASDESRAFNTTLGAAGGMGGNAIVNTIGRIAQPVKNFTTAAGAKAVDVLENAGIPLDAAQRTGNEFLSRLKSSFSDNPFTMFRQKELGQEQQDAFTRAGLRIIGSDGEKATKDVMGNNLSRVNGVFEDILGRNNVKVGDDLVGKLSELQKNASDEEKNSVVNIINRIIDKTDDSGTLSGQLAYGIKKDLDRLSSTQDSSQNYYARSVRSALMDAMNDSLDGADKQAFSQARQQFKGMKQIEGAIDNEGIGDISPSKLANSLGSKKNIKQSKYGYGNQELVDLAQSGKQLLPDKFSNSGTAARIAMQAAPAAIAGIGSGLYNGDFGDAALAAGAVYGFPRLAQSVLTNQTSAKYLANGFGKTVEPGALNSVARIIRSATMAPQESQALGGALKYLPNSYSRGAFSTEAGK